MFGHFLTELKGKLALKGRWSIVLKVIVRLTDGQSAGKDPRSTIKDKLGLKNKNYRKTKIQYRKSALTDGLSDEKDRLVLAHTTQ